LSCVVMPGRSHRGPLPAATDAQRALADELRRDVEHLAGAIGERNVHKAGTLDVARGWIAGELARAGYEVEQQAWDESGVECANVIAGLRGARPEIVLVGAHYDTVAGCPGADDNASGVAALLAIARRMAGSKPERTVRFVAFANEEEPFFGESRMGSAFHARRCRERGEEIAVMLSLETIACYDDSPASQRYPAPGLGLLYPSTGDFLCFVGDTSSRRWVRDAVRAFRETTAFPCEGAALPASIPGVSWSDQLSFWEHGYPALMATDTAPFRNPRYHTPRDRPETLDYERFARATEGLQRVVERWAAGR
jgi:Zn-dependent M28 family amino/carboxypeptidase